MGHSRTEDPRLGQVKAVLQRLQQFAADPSSVAPQSAGQHGGQRMRLARRTAVLASAIAAAITLILLGMHVFFNFGRHAVATNRPPASAGKGAPDVAADAATPRQANLPEPVSIGQSPAPQPSQTLQVALGLMHAGQIKAARGELLRIASEGSADVAWSLARSYDPNFLNSLPAADADANIAEATRWYRTWYAIAVRQGLVADSVSLERIIGSMR